MTRWLAARQNGIAKDRNLLHSANAKVYHACEVNLVWQAMELAEPSITTDVITHVNTDLISYSAWDTKNSPQKFSRALEFIAKHHHSKAAKNFNKIYVVEFGVPESESTPSEAYERAKQLTERARAFGCPYAIYWQLYCNEPLNSQPKTNSDFKGF